MIMLRKDKLHKGIWHQNIVTGMFNRFSSRKDDSLGDMSLLNGAAYSGILNYKIFVSTWNVGGVTPMDDLNLEDWLDKRNNSYDIYVLGFQEIVPLSARNVLGPENSKIMAKWNSLIRATLNKSVSDHNTTDHIQLAESQKEKLYDAREYGCIISKQMVGISASVWVRSDLLEYISYPSVSCIGCGLMGYLGNKGSVAVRFCLHETSFCFVCCHLASGGKEGDEMYRNSNATDIFSRTCFRNNLSPGMPKKILDHERIVLLGDLNYRIALPEAKLLSIVKDKEWGKLLEKDQLRAEFTEGRTFDGWNEGVIAFSPTYKYQLNSDEYQAFAQRKNSKKWRAPAWCDRILWFGDGLKQNRYERCELRLSDHRPVRAIFTAEVEVLKYELMHFRSSMSHNFERNVNKFEICY